MPSSTVPTTRIEFPGLRFKMLFGVDVDVVLLLDVVEVVCGVDRCGGGRRNDDDASIDDDDDGVDKRTDECCGNGIKGCNGLEVGVEETAWTANKGFVVGEARDSNEPRLLNGGREVVEQDIDGSNGWV